MWKQPEYRQLNLSVDYFFCAEVCTHVQQLRHYYTYDNENAFKIQKYRWLVLILHVSDKIKIGICNRTFEITALFRAHETFMVDWLEAICSSKSIYSPWTCSCTSEIILLLVRKKTCFLLHFLFHSLYFQLCFFIYDFLRLKKTNENENSF